MHGIRSLRREKIIPLDFAQKECKMKTKYCLVGIMMVALSAQVSACVVQERTTDGGFTLKNNCSYTVNILYKFSQSKPMTGGYVTLQPGENTFNVAKSGESYEMKYCKFPGVPQSLTGGCI